MKKRVNSSSEGFPFKNQLEITTEWVYNRSRLYTVDVGAFAVSLVFLNLT